MRYIEVAFKNYWCI